MANDGFLPQKFEPLTDRLLFVRLSEAEIRAASFLDDRVLRPQMEGFWTTIEEAARRATPRPVNYIFHAGHTGSTLLSRLLETSGVLPVREPLPLRTFADLHDILVTPHSLFDRDAFSHRLHTFLRLSACGLEHTKTVLIKATSTVGRIAPALLDAPDAAKAVYLTVSAESYLATLLAGPNAIIDLRGHAQERNRRLEKHLGEAPLVLHRASVGELAAMAWLAEMLARQAAVQHAPDRVLSVDFDAMLSDLDGTLATVARHFGVPLPEPTAIAAILGRYSKAPEHAYSPALRHQLLAQARGEHAAEMRKGLQWLGDTAARFPLAATVVDNSRQGAV